MPTIIVPLGERSYPIIVEPGILGRMSELPLPNELAILSNTRVAPLYAEPLGELLKPSRRVFHFNQPEGEAYKSWEWMGRAYDALAEFGLTRQGGIVAVGGGVVGDWAGFVAATWMRGIDFIQVPTTLLAMVDSSVGGKTGINHPRAKNLIGAFHQPKLVAIDPLCLGSLPARELSAGLAEVIKYGVIADAAFFAWIEEHIGAARNLDSEALQHIIVRSCEIKAAVVGADERESDSSGQRATLNYGHTAGHALEATTAYGTLLHGEAIAIGMMIAARLAVALGTIDRAEGEDLIRRQERLFLAAGLPVAVPPGVSFEALWGAMALDKKARGNSINFILPTRIGAVKRVEGVSAEAVRAVLESGIGK